MSSTDIVFIGIISLSVLLLVVSYLISAKREPAPPPPPPRLTDNWHQGPPVEAAAGGWQYEDLISFASYAIWQHDRKRLKDPKHRHVKEWLKRKLKDPLHDPRYQQLLEDLNKIPAQ